MPWNHIVRLLQLWTVAPIVLIGCGTGSGSSTTAQSRQSVVCPAGVGASGLSDADRARIFDALTKNEWLGSACASSEALPPTCNQLELGSDGTYHFSAVSDYTERDDRGSWNFALTDATSGVLCLDGRSATPARSFDAPNQPSALFFQLSGESLKLDVDSFSPGTATSSTGSVSELRSVNLPSEYGRLFAEPWKKTNTFDLFMLPDEVTYRPTGRFDASYRSGACAHGGHFSWDKGMLTPISDPNQCDLRGPTTAYIGASNEWPSYDDDLLVLYDASYRPKSSTSTTSVFIFDPYSDSMTVRGEFDGELTANVATELTLEFQNVEDRSRDLIGLEVTAQTVTPAPGGNGFVASGQEVILANRDYTGVTLAPQAVHVDTFSITPPEIGDNVLFRFTIDYKDELQSYHGSRDFLTAVP